MAEGGPGKGGGGEDPAKSTEQEDRTRAQILSGTGFCKWFNVRMGFGFISMTSSEGSPVDSPLDVFVHQSKLVMEGFRSLKEGEQVEFTYKKSSKGLESLRVTGPCGDPARAVKGDSRGRSLSRNANQRETAVITVEVWITMPRSVACPPAKEMPLLPECNAHGGSVSPQGAGAPTGSQDQHASTSAPIPGTGPYLCPPEEEEHSGSSPLEGSSSSPEEPHTHRGPRTQRWRKS